MKNIKDYLCFSTVAIGIFLIVVTGLKRCGEEKAQPLTRAIDTVNIGATANDGTGDPLRTAFIKVNENLYMQDTLGIDIMRALDFTRLRNTEYDSLSRLATDYYAIYESGDTLPPHVPDAYTDDPYDLFPEIHAFAGDTSNYATPDKIGDLFINTSTQKIYVSVSTIRGGWVILN